jgi:hypothetical protein
MPIGGIIALILFSFVAVGIIVFVIVWATKGKLWGKGPVPMFSPLDLEYEEKTPQQGKQYFFFKKLTWGSELGLLNASE